MITSPNNNKIKEINKLFKTRERKKQTMIVVEGEREIELAINNKFIIQDFYICPEIIKNNKFLKENIIFTKLNLATFKKISYKEKPDGYLAVIKPKFLELEKMKVKKNPFIIILETVEKPGNLGAICRTAYAAKVDAIIINNPQTDIYNPNVIRASMGHVFTNQIIIADIKNTQNWLKKNNIKTFGTTIKAKKSYHKANFSAPTALIMGTEAKGLTKEWLKNIDEEITIPMQKGIDSLNVSVSTAIISYEVLRQRNFVDF